MEAIVSALVSKDDAGVLWLTYFTGDLRHLVKIGDVAKLYTDYVNVIKANVEVAELNADLQDKLAALTDLLANIQECRKLGDHMLRKQINTALELYEETMKGAS